MTIELLILGLALVALMAALLLVRKAEHILRDSDQNLRRAKRLHDLAARTWLS